MIDRPMTLCYKAVIDVYAPEESNFPEPRGLFTRLLDIVHDYLASATRLDINRGYLENYGQLTSADARQKATIASHHLLETNPYPFLWAIKITQQDDENRYRTWATHIGINQDSDAHLELYFAMFYADNVSGRLGNVHTPPKVTPVFVAMLLESKDIVCVTGNYIVPTEPIHMTYDDIPFLKDMLFDPQRTLPIIFHTCPHLIDPAGLHMRLLGNAVLYYTSDVGVIIETSLSLPDHLQIEQDYIWFFMPPVDGELHPPASIDARDIVSKGPRKIVDIISQAYSEHLRSRERDGFITISHIFDLRNARKVEELEKGSLRLSAKVKELNAKMSKIEQEKEAAHAVLSAMKARGILEYEELLSSCMQELDATKDALKGLVNRLYLDMGKNYLPQNHESALMNELEKALYACFSMRR